MPNVKINLSTPPDQILDTMNEEVHRAIAWYNKKIGKDKGECKKKQDALDILDKQHEPQDVFYTEWLSPTTQNRYLVSQTLYPASNDILYNYRDWYVCFYESHGSVGMFVSYSPGNNDNVMHGEIKRPHNIILCLTSHFFLRYCDQERKLGTMHDDKQQVLLDFFKRNEIFLGNDTINVYTNKDGQQCVDVCLSGCVGRGKVIQGERAVIYELDTCLAWNMLFPCQYKDCKSIIDAYEKLLNSLHNRHYPKPNELMNTLQQQELKRVLKDNGVKNFTTLPQSFSLNSSKYLDLAEPIYVISRLQPYVNSDNERSKMLSAQKAWINIVVERDWCSALKPYIEQHGKTLVSMAIEYCIDNDLWDSPKGNTALRTHQSDHYKGLEAINEAVEYLKGEGLCDDIPSEQAQQEYNTEITNTEPELVDFTDEDNDFNSSAASAYMVGKDIVDSLSVAQDNLSKVMSFLNFAKQREVMDFEKENQRLTSKITSLTSALTTAKQDLQKAKDERNEVQQNYNAKSKDYDRIVKTKRDQAEIIKLQADEIKNLKKELEDSNNALQKIKEQSKLAETLPKRKILKESELRRLPLVGDKMLSGLIPYLEKNGIIVDINK